jgi:hypothetical protein
VLFPKDGWEDFPRNLEVGDVVYSKLIPLANSGDIDYTNFMSGSGMFESEFGLLNIELDTAEEDEIDFIKCLSIAYEKNGAGNVFKELALYLKSEFGLIEIDS